MPNRFRLATATLSVATRPAFRHSLSMAALLTPLFLQACRDLPERVGPTEPPPKSVVVQDIDDVGRDGEHLFRSLSRVAPSSAGFYYTEDGTLVVRVRDAKDDVASLAFVRDLVRANPGYNPGGGKLARGFRVERSEYTFVELANIRNQISEKVLGSVVGVVTVDLDERANRVVVGTQSTADRLPLTQAEVQRALGASSATERLVTYKLQQKSQYIAHSAPPLTLTSGSSDPLAGGQQIVRGGSLDGCTVGFVAQRNGILGFVTASHCSSMMFFPDFSQWSMLPNSPPVLAMESVDPSYYTCGIAAYNCRGADALFASSTGQHPMAVGKILRTVSLGTGLLDVNQSKPYFTAIYSQDDVLLGQNVDMIGRTSGWRTGNVVSTCIDQLMVPNWPQSTSTYQIRCAAQGSYAADGGDSGGPMFIRVPGHPEIQGSELPGAPFWTDEFVSIVGIHSGHAFGMRFFSKLGRIKSDLGGSWVITAPVPALPAAPLSTFVTGSTDVLASSSCNLRYVANATGGLWNTYSYTFNTSGQIKFQNGREIIVAFASNGSHHVSVTVTDGNNNTVSHSLTLIAGPSGMDCNTV